MSVLKVFLPLLLLAVCLLSRVSCQGNVFRNLDQTFKDQIMANDDAVNQILRYLNHGTGKHMTYNRLAEFVDKFGSRFTGTLTLENSIDYMKQELEKEGFDRVYTEPVTVPRWIRGAEKATLLQPRQVNLYVMGLMNSVSGTVEAEVLVVKSFDELYEKRAQAVGKIVVYNQEWTDYVAGYVYRTMGAAHAKNVGAKAALIRSIADFSIYSPHTGSQQHWDNQTAIPSACITIEDAMMLQRMQDRGDTIRISFQSTHQKLSDSTSRNLIAEITGSEFPDEYVLFGGHIDSWDVGVGAMDDGGGMLVTRQILTTMKALGLKPRRTMRLVMWTAEEIGILGGHEHFNQYKNLLDKMSFVMESDFGTFSPIGLGVHNISGLARAILEEIMERYLGDLKADKVLIGGLGKADISDWIKHGVPGATLQSNTEKYFYFHHTEGDRMTVEDPDELDRCASMFTVAAYVVANMDTILPRYGEYPTKPVMPSSATTLVAWSSINLIAFLLLMMLRN